ncbi:protein cholesin [Sarcophilus harrisii]
MTTIPQRDRRRYWSVGRRGLAHFLGRGSGRRQGRASDARARESLAWVLEGCLRSVAWRGRGRASGCARPPGPAVCAFTTPFSVRHHQARAVCRPQLPHRMPEQKKKRSEVSEKKKRKFKELVEGEKPLKKKKLSVKISSDPLDTEISQMDAASDEEKQDEQELTTEEMRTLERKLKKERKKEQKKQLREAGIRVVKENPEKPSGAELALDYLTSWANKREEWKFQKTRQTWLLLHMYDSNKVPDKHFSILLDYLEGLKGRAREVTVQKAETLMKKLDNTEPEDSSLLEKSERIRQILQLLS